MSNNLRSKGVKLPAAATTLGSALLCLCENLGDYVHIDAIKDYLVDKRIQLRGGDPVQVRHLSTQKGLCITKQGRYDYYLNSLDEAHPSFIPEKRSCVLTCEQWEKMLNEYDYMCACCGSKQGEPMRWDKCVIAKLQQGHMDPRKSLTTDNSIPQCAFCNQSSKDKRIFNKRGQTIEMLWYVFC